jgi:hypothetical protein
VTETAKGRIRYYIVKNNPEKNKDLIDDIPNSFEGVETPEERGGGTAKIYS